MMRSLVGSYCIPLQLYIHFAFLHPSPHPALLKSRKQCTLSPDEMATKAQTTATQHVEKATRNMEEIKKQVMEREAKGRITREQNVAESMSCVPLFFFSACPAHALPREEEVRAHGE